MITKRTSRVLSLLLAAVMTLGMFAATPVPVQATVGTAGEYLIVTPSGTSVNPGDTVSFTVVGYQSTGIVDSLLIQNVTWSATTGTLSSTTGSSVTLTVDAGESATSVTVTATSTDVSFGTITENVTVTINQLPVLSSDATLSSLTVSDGTLYPAFSAGTTSYTVSVYNSVTLITVTAMANDSANGAGVTAGNGSHNLNVGANTITVTVTAADGTTKDYIITVTRASYAGNSSSSSSSGGVTLNKPGLITPPNNGGKITVNGTSLTYTLTADKVAVFTPDKATLAAMIDKSKIITLNLSEDLGLAGTLINIDDKLFIENPTLSFDINYGDKGGVSIPSITFTEIPKGSLGLGGIQNRLEHTIQSSGIADESLKATESRIRDLDKAHEMGAFTKNIIFQQVAQSMMELTNQANTSVFSQLGSIEFVVLSGDKIVTWNDPAFASTVFVAYDAKGADTNAAVLYNVDTGKIVAHSFFADGKVYGMVNGPGHYDAKAAPIGFSDTRSHYLEGDITFAASRGLISGMETGVFSPNTAITRAEFIMALGKLSGADVSGYKNSSFTDVASTDHTMPYIEWARENNIVQGAGDNKFAPDATITNEQTAIMLVNYARATNHTLPAIRQGAAFSDAEKISGWAVEGVKAVQSAAVMEGKQGNLFDPKGNATRAEACEILRRFAIAVVNE